MGMEIVVTRESGQEIMTPAAFGLYMADTIILWFASSRNRSQAKTHEKLTYERHRNTNILNGLSGDDKKEALMSFAERMEIALANTDKNFWIIPSKQSMELDKLI